MQVLLPSQGLFLEVVSGGCVINTC